MSCQRGVLRDLWSDIVSQNEEEEKDDEQPEAHPHPQIAVVYGRRRAGNENPREEAPIGRRSNGLGGEARVSLVPTKRISWKRSLSIRGRESILVAAGIDFRPQPNKSGAQKKGKQGLQSKKIGRKPPDFRKEKAYFEEVDSFELIEESPSPKHFGTWEMGTKHDYVVYDLPAILERWRISKLASTGRPSKQLFKIMETPEIPSAESCYSEKTPERAFRTMAGERASIVDLNDDCILTSLKSLQIKDDDVASDVFEEVENSKQVFEDIDEAIKKESGELPPASLGSECLSAFAQLLMVCRQSAPARFSEVFSVYCDPSSIVKIGEGTYGEAFRAGDTVCKVVPIDGKLLVNGEVQKKSEEVLEEALLSLTLNNLRDQKEEPNSLNLCTSFIETKDFRVCQGAYDTALISAWEDWDAKNGSENGHPSEFPKEQCYIVFVLADGGKDLESFVLLNFDEARSLLVQVTAALAVAESACEFEHRDLHWGNILLSRKEGTIVDFTLEGKKMSANTFGLTISIIDFTLSRINTGEAILFLDLSADPELFDGPKGDRQSETYRQMAKVTNKCWEGSFPKTNVLWLMYLVDILLTKKSFKRTAKDERELRSLKKRLHSYSSAKESISDSFFQDLLDHNDSA